MIDIDKYINLGIEMKVLGKEITIKQPSAKLTREINAMEKDMTEENYLDIREDVTLKILNNNVEGIILTKEGVAEIPFKLQTLITNELAKVVYEIENNPN
jgi:hypothetical protein